MFIVGFEFAEPWAGFMVGHHFVHCRDDSDMDRVLRVSLV
jgi:hypothetical protein